MKIAWITDPHLDQESLTQNRLDIFLTKISNSTADAFIISGDISIWPRLIEHLKLIEQHAQRPVFFVLGNHDYHGGSFFQVDTDLKQFIQNSKYLRWLDHEDVISLSPQTALIGHSSWADGESGNYFQSKLYIHDFSMIRDFKMSGGDHKNWNKKIMMHRAHMALYHLEETLEKALQTHKNILLVTHVPPFEKSCRYLDGPTETNFIPFFCCSTVGNYILKVMNKYPHNNLTVIAGHTHYSFDEKILPHLHVTVGDADYGNPKIQKIFNIK